MTRNPFEGTAAEWQSMVDALAMAEEQRRQATQLNIGLLAENDALQKQLADANRERKYLMAYAGELTTRLDVIMEVITVAKSEAAKFARKPQVVPVETPQEPDDGAREMGERFAPAGDRLPVVRFAR